MDSSAFQKPVAAKKQHAYTNDGVLEALRGLGTGVGQTAVQDVAGKVASDAFASLFGGPTQGELHANQSIDFSKSHDGGFEQPAPRFHQPENHRSALISQDAAMVKQQIDAVRAELKAIAGSIQSLNKEIQNAVNEVPVMPGIYHVNFFDRLKSMLQVLREQIDDSRSWLAMSGSKKQKKGYWGMYKKHGTTFGLSNERSLATQAG